MPDNAASQARPNIVHLFAYPFRIFFFSVGLLALVSVPVWVALLSGRLDLPLALPPIHWHQHELVFGWLQAAIAGFLLTAVCVWTGTERTHGWPLLGLWLVWLAGRLAITFGAAAPEWLVWGLNLAFLPLVMLDAGWRIWQARQLRQMVIMVVLGLLWLMQLGFLLDPAGPYIPAALIVASALMLVIGGRITPNFSMGWLKRHGLDADAVRVIPALEKTLLATLALTLLAMVTGNALMIGLAATLAGGVALLRIGLWQGWRVRQEPLLWILHLSLLWIPIGFFLLAGAQAGWWTDTVWMHAIGVGAMGGLILGVVSRVILGHTGRELRLPRGMTSAFVLIHLAALTRIATGMELIPWQAGINISGLLWFVAYGLFLIRYTGFLLRPRADGRPG